jgi:predicted nucleic acid-binding protein
VLVDIWQRDPEWAIWSVTQLRAQSQVHELLINPIIYAELSFSFESLEQLDARVEGLALKFRDIPRSALFLAGKAFVKYRRAGGTRTNVLSDFFIGAHAAVLRCGVLTRDPARYRRYFSTVQMVSPAV